MVLVSIRQWGLTPRRLDDGYSLWFDSINPGILFHLLQHSDYTVDQLDRLLNHNSGLLRISGISNDLRQITKAMTTGNKRAKLAFDLFIHRLRSNIGTMIASLGGVDVLVFTAGIGENSAAIRSAACEGFEFLGLSINLSKSNATPVNLDISQPGAQVRVLEIGRAHV